MHTERTNLQGFLKIITFDDRCKSVGSVLIRGRVFSNIFLGIVALTIVLCATNPPAASASIPEIKQSSVGPSRRALLPYQNPKLPVEERVRDLLKRMTLPEKARQLDMYSGAKDFLDPGQRADNTHAKPDAVFNPARAEKVLGNLGAGSIHDIYPSPQLYNVIQKWVIDHKRLGIPALFIEEGLHGYLGLDQTVFPQSVNLASTWDTKLAREEGSAIASEARADGVDMLLTPVVNLARDPRWGRVEETFGEDPFLTGRIGLAYVEGMQGKSLATDSTCVSEPKHFAGYGVPESGLNTAPTHAGKREMLTVLLKPFEPLVREGHVMGIMAAYNSVDGLPCTANPWLLTTVLRDDWGFKGLVLSDLGAIRRLYDIFHVAATPGDAVRLAIKSGVDMQFYDFPHDTFQNAIIEGVRDGKISVAAVNRAVAHVLRVKFLLGLFDHPYVDPNLDKRVSRSPAHLALSREVARQSICLLKNENDLLPLNRDLSSIAVIGPNADSTRLGDYSAMPGDRTQQGLLAQIRKYVSSGTKVLYARGDSIDHGVEIARQAKVVILALGENSRISGEGHDRSQLGLPGNQEELLRAVVATGVPVVLVLQNGRPLAIPWADKHVPAILEAWYPGEFGGRAIVETLFGENNPSGHLVMSFPRDVGQLPDYYDHGPSKFTSYVDGKSSPLFPFGYGLSYTTFKFSDLKVDAPSIRSRRDVSVTFKISNTGKIAGDEVAQVYVREENASVETPVRSLKGFQRIHLLPGKSRKVTVYIKQSDLEVWGANREWDLEPGGFKVFVGGSSEAKLSGEFSLR